jgi:hypothetical protein
MLMDADDALKLDIIRKLPEFLRVDLLLPLLPKDDPGPPRCPLLLVEVVILSMSTSVK